MYVPQGSVPRNSMSPLDPGKVARSNARIRQTDRAVLKAFLDVECPPSPISFTEQPSQIQAQVAIAQQRGILPAIARGPGSVEATQPGQAAKPPTLQEIREAIRSAPQVVPLNGNVLGPTCSNLYIPKGPRQTPQPIALKPAPALVLDTKQWIAPVISPPRAQVPPQAVQISANAAPQIFPPSNPCGAGARFIGYVGGVPNCVIGSGGIPISPQGPHGYASIGLGDLPPWNNGFVEASPLISPQKFPVWGWIAAATLVALVAFSGQKG